MMFDGLPRAVTVAVSNLTRDNYGYVQDERALTAELERMGWDVPEQEAMWNLLRRLQADEVRQCVLAGAYNYGLIELDSCGRQEVEGWPRPDRPSTAAVMTLVAVLNERAEDEALPVEERSKLRAAAGLWAASP
ncbi:MAG: hypothetical protein U0S48_18250 [Solirubrobacteraceae bacterium]